MKKKETFYMTAIFIVILEIAMKLLGFVKQSVVAYYFGATGLTDIYFVANEFIANLSVVLITSAKVAIISVYTSVRINEGDTEGNKLISGVSEIIVFAICICMLIVMGCSKQLAFLLAPAFSYEQSNQLSEYLIILSGVLFFTGIIMILEAVLNSNEKYMVTRIRSFIYSVCVIIACVLYSKTKGIIALVAAQYFSFVIYLAIQIVASRKYFKFRLINPFKNRYISQILKMMFPVMAGNSVVQINYMVDKAVASGLEEGAVSALAYSQILDHFFTGVIISSVCSVVFSHFANLIANQQEGKIIKTVNDALSILVLLLIPIILIVFACGKEITEIVYYRGNFTYDMVLLSALALQGYAIRYVFVAIRDILIQANYAYKDTKNPMISACIAALINIVVSVGLVNIIGITAITLGTTVSAFIGMLLNMHTFKMKINGYDFKFLKGIFVKSVPSVLISSVFIIIRKKCVFIESAIISLIVTSLIVFVSYYLIIVLLREEETLRLIRKVQRLVVNRMKKR